jgi:hypothetical protein
MLHLFFFFSTNKSYRQSRYYSLHWAVSPVTTAYTGRILFGKTSPTNSLIAKNVFDAPKKRTILCHSVLSVLAYLPLQNVCVFPIFESYYVSIFIPKSKTDIYRDGNTVVISRMDNNLYPVKQFRKVFIVVE